TAGRRPPPRRRPRRRWRRCASGGRGSYPNHPHPPRDLLGRDQLALVAPWALRRGSGPGFGRLGVAVPERPRSGLSRAHRVNRTPGLAVVEHAVAVGLLLERPSRALAARVQAEDFRHRLAAELGDGPHLVVVHPDEPGRTRATVPAPCAGEP